MLASLLPTGVGILLYLTNRTQMSLHTISLYRFGHGFKILFYEVHDYWTF